jgi:hypothetical protein
MKVLAVLMVAILPAFAAEAQSNPSPDGGTAAAPWGVQIAGNYSKAQAMADFIALQTKFSAILTTRPPMIFTGKMAGGGQGSFYEVRVPADTRDEAEDICKKLKAAGGACVVVKS